MADGHVRPGAWYVQHVGGVRTDYEIASVSGTGRRDTVVVLVYTPDTGMAPPAAVEWSYQTVLAGIALGRWHEPFAPQLLGARTAELAPRGRGAWRGLVRPRRLEPTEVAYDVEVGPAGWRLSTDTGMWLGDVGDGLLTEQHVLALVYALLRADGRPACAAGWDGTGPLRRLSALAGAGR